MPPVSDTRPAPGIERSCEMPSILIIDDSAYTRNKIREVLKSERYDILEASDGTKGLEMVYSHTPDCIILDLIMPEIDGIKILKVLHDKGSKIPVIVVTADIQDSVRKQCLAFGAAAFINKPPREDELRGAVKKAFRLG